jgi:hypothetical protein
MTEDMLSSMFNIGVRRMQVTDAGQVYSICLPVSLTSQESPSGFSQTRETSHQISAVLSQTQGTCDQVTGERTRDQKKEVLT